MNVLSLFDGMSCGRIALERAGIPVTNYFASEIDKHAIKVSKANWPDIKHIGSVVFVNVEYDPVNNTTRIYNWLTGEDFTFEGIIDLTIGGSPCQGFSFAGKQLNFNDPRSALFFEFVRLREESNATYFLLENVRMKKESEDIITEVMGVQPHRLNSALVSAQNRKRLYWTNIPYFSNPADKGIILRDILESDFSTEQDVKSLCLSAGYCNNPSLRDYAKSQKQLVKGKNKGGFHEFKAPTLSTNSWQENNKLTNGILYRKLTPTECERLQTVPDNYTAHVSNTQRYRMLGNGWTVDMIAHLFQPLLIADIL